MTVSEASAGFSWFFGCTLLLMAIAGGSQALTPVLLVLGLPLVLFFGRHTWDAWRDRPRLDDPDDWPLVMLSLVVHLVGSGLLIVYFMLVHR